MRKVGSTTPLYVRIDPNLDTAMRKAVRASPVKRTLSDFVRTAIQTQLGMEGGGAKGK